MSAVISRRGFVGLAGAAFAGLPCGGAPAGACADPAVGKPLPGWKPGHFQLHAIYTGVAESMLLVYPDGTSMLLDCGDHAAINRGRLAVPVLPDGSRHAGEWISRYVERVNPRGRDVDYMVISHFHSDHTGCESWHAGKTSGRGEDYFLSGFAQAAETLRFGTAVDRGWPRYDDPLPLAPEYDDGSLRNIQRLYRHLQARDGLRVEKFRLGAEDQFLPRRDASACSGFAVRNICANGRIALTDGTVRDLYESRLAGARPKALNENGMSLGMLVTYGKFRLFTAGDFSDGWKASDGVKHDIERDFAMTLPPVNVAKVNHHGHHSMPPELVKALRPQIWFSCVWDQLHNTTDTMSRLLGCDSRHGDCLIAPGIMPAERRWEDAGAAWMDYVAKESFAGGHLVFDVPPGGSDYSLSYVSADDESMTVRGVFRFKS